MKINRHNYEEFFILYMDNELGREDRKQVELFVQQNADLEEELAMLQQSKLVADTAVGFGDKEILMKSASVDLINMNNYEEWLLLYNDNELTAAQKIAVEKFVDQHPQAKTELELLQKVKVLPEENIVFADKEILYKREEKVRVIGIRWWRIAAAAVLLVGVSVTAFVLLNQEKKQGNDLVATGEKKLTAPVKNNIPVAQKDDNVSTGDIAVKEKSEKEKTEIKIENAVATKKANDSKKENIEVQEKQEDFIAKEDEKNKNDLPQPGYDAKMKGNIKENSAIAFNDTPSKEALTNQKENISLSTVTPVYTKALNPTDDGIDTEQPEKKNKLRGLFRKVTRTFEKTTGVKATDDDDRLLIAGLAIKL
ncbi:MAG: hypothetical protein WDN26_22820 [Chitinophagaceae bacterium]